MKYINFIGISFLSLVLFIPTELPATLSMASFSDSDLIARRGGGGHHSRGGGERHNHGSGESYHPQHERRNSSNDSEHENTESDSEYHHGGRHNERHDDNTEVYYGGDYNDSESYNEESQSYENDENGPSSLSQPEGYFEFNKYFPEDDN